MAMEKERQCVAHVTPLRARLRARAVVVGVADPSAPASRPPSSKDLMDKFASSIEDINGKFEAHTKERATLVEENEEFVRAGRREGQGPLSPANSRVTGNHPACVRVCLRALAACGKS